MSPRDESQNGTKLRRRARDRGDSRAPQSRNDLATAIPSRRVTILVVEDDPALLAMYKGALLIGGFSVITAADGLDALNRIETETPDLIVLDLGLPRLSGRDLHREFAAHTNTRQVPIIVVTGESGDLPGFDCVLHKPVDGAGLLAAVERCLQLNRL